MTSANVSYVHLPLSVVRGGTSGASGHLLSETKSYVRLAGFLMERLHPQVRCLLPVYGWETFSAHAYVALVALMGFAFGWLYVGLLG